MTDYFVDSRNGNDANDGLSIAQAKKTAGGAYSASVNGDTIFLNGVFGETVVSLALEGRIWEKFSGGFAFFDGGGTAAAAFTNTSSGSPAVHTFKGIEFQNHTVAAFSGAGGTRNEDIAVMEDCVFDNEPIAIDGSDWFFASSNSTRGCFRTVFSNCAEVYAATGWGGSGEFTRFNNCTFFNCAKGLQSNGASLAGLQVANCIFRKCAIMMNLRAGSQLQESDGNCYDFTNGKMQIDDVDISPNTLDRWKAVSTGPDTDSIDADPVFVDEDKALLGLLPGSPCLTLGSSALPSAQGTNTSGALVIQMDGVSTNHNASFWNAALLVDCEINVDGDIQLSLGESIGTATIILDLSESRDIARLLVSQDFNYPTSILDKDKSDTLPQTWTVEFATSDDNITYSAFSDVNLTRPDLGVTGKRFLKVRFTLRQDA